MNIVGLKQNISKRMPVYSKKMCPYVENPPSDDCYNVKLDSCRDTNSMIEAILEYCNKNYSACEIYKVHSAKNRRPKQEDTNFILNVSS